MKLRVPFYKQKREADCGLLALKMVLSYFGEDYSFEKISKLERQLSTGLVWSAGIARAARKLGFPTKLISITDFNPEETNIGFYRKYSNNKGMIVLNKLLDEIQKIGVEIEEKNLSLNKLLSYVTKDSVPIVLVNWYVIAGKKGFNGHAIPITGYDKKNIYVHNPGLKNTMPYFPIKRDKFLKAWESKGTDKDTIIIYRKN